MKKDGKLPEWLRTELQNTLEDLEGVSKTLYTAMRGFHLATQIPNIIRVLGKAEGTDQEEVENKVDDYKDRVDFAIQQQEEGFPLLHEQAIILLWSTLESSVIRVVEMHIQKHPELLENEKFEGIQIPVKYIFKENGIETSHEIIKAIERKRGRLPNLERLELLLEYIGWPKKSKSSYSQELIELASVRNLLVHRRGYIDGQFLNSCKWRQESIGTRLVIKKEDFKAYEWAATCYFLDMLNRSLLHRGVRHIEQIEIPDRPKVREDF